MRLVPGNLRERETEAMVSLGCTGVISPFQPGREKSPDLLHFGLHRLPVQQSADLYDLILNRHQTSGFVITSNHAGDEWLSLFDGPVPGNRSLGRLASARYRTVIVELHLPGRGVAGPEPAGGKWGDRPAICNLIQVQGKDVQGYHDACEYPFPITGRVEKDISGGSVNIGFHIWDPFIVIQQREC